MKVAASMLFCLLLSVLSQTVNTSLEQEMEAKAREIQPIVFSKCGEDHFSKRIMRYRSGGEA